MIAALLSLQFGFVACSSDSDDNFSTAESENSESSEISNSGSTPEFENNARANCMVKVAGGTYDGTTALTPESRIFISGRKISIDDLYICDHEVTNAEYEKYCKHDRNWYCGGSYDSYPAVFVSWYDAVVYCNLRSIAEGFTPAYSINDETAPSKWPDIESESQGVTTKYSAPYNENTAWKSLVYNTAANGYRLPTEAEWEYIARGGPEWKSYTYSGSDTIDEVACYNNGNDLYTEGLQEVKTKKPNNLGIYDMSGNASEWCYDRYSFYEKYRVQKGGNAMNSAYSCEVASQSYSAPDSHLSTGGFRVVRSSCQLPAA